MWLKPLNKDKLLPIGLAFCAGQLSNANLFLAIIIALFVHEIIARTLELRRLNAGCSHD